MTKRYGDVAGDGGSNIQAQVEEMSGRIRARMARVRRKAAIASGKGGVGKSVLTSNLAVSLAAGGWRVGVLDADLNGPSMAKTLGVRGQRLRLSSQGMHPAEGPYGIKVLSMDLFLPAGPAPLVWEATTQAESFVWRDSMETTALREFLADTAWGDLDVLLLDLPPGAPTLPALAASLGGLDGAVMVTIPSEVAQLTVGRATELARAHGVTLLGVVENMADYCCPRCGAAEAGLVRAGRSPSEALGLPCLGRIPFDPRVAACADRGRPFLLEYPATPAGRALGELGGRLSALLLREGR